MSGDLKWNKIFGAGLGTAFFIILVQQVSGAVYSSPEVEEMGYRVEVAEETGGAEEVVLPPDWGTLIPVADLAAGEAAFARCQACHTINAGGANGIGPNLNGVVGRAVASHGGFAYSEAMAGHTSIDPTWSLDAMDSFITAPGRYVNGTKMSFAGLRDAEARHNLIAWIMSQGSAGYPVPAPDPARQPGAAVDPALEADAEGAAPAGEGDGAVPVAGTAGQAETQTSPVAAPAATSPAPPNT